MNDDALPLAIPTFIKKRRKLLKMGQAALAEEAGVSPTTIHNIEAGKNGFTDKSLAQIAKGLKCTPAEVLIDPDADKAPIVGNDAIMAILSRIKGLEGKHLTIAFSMITTAIDLSAAVSERNQPHVQSEQTIGHREGTS